MENNKKSVSVFETLNSINVSGKTEKKNSLTYLSWPYAWGEVKKLYPTAQYHVYERDTQWGPVNYFTDGKTCWVKVGVTIDGLEHVEMLPVMDYRNKSIALDKVTSCDVNKTIQRAITKAIGRHGLGLYVYAKEDYPDTAPTQSAQTLVKAAPQAPAQPQATAQKPARDTRLGTVNEIKAIRQVLNENGMDEQFICRAYRVHNLQDLRMYQYHHILGNIQKLKSMYDAEKKAKKQQRLIDIVKDSKQKQAEARTELTFGDAIAPPQPQQKTEGEEVSLESLGLSPADLDALTECGNIFS